MSDRGTHFVLSKKKHKIFLKDPVFPEGGHQAPCFIVIYRRNGRKIAKPLEHGESCTIGVKPGRHVVDIKMPHTGLVDLDKKLETRELAPGEMQVIEVAICGLTIPYTKVWDLGKMHCPIAVVEKKKKKKEAPPPEPEETTTTTTTTYTAQLMPIMAPPQYTTTTTMYSLPTTTTTYGATPSVPMYTGQSMYYPSAPLSGQPPLPQGFTPLGGPMMAPMGPMSPSLGAPPTYNPFTNPSPMGMPSVPQTGMMFPTSPMMMPPQNMPPSPMLQPMMQPSPFNTNSPTWQPK